MEEINMPSYVFREFCPFKHTFPNASTLKNKDVCNLYYDYILRSIRKTSQILKYSKRKVTAFRAGSLRKKLRTPRLGRNLLV